MSAPVLTTNKTDQKQEIILPLKINVDGSVEIIDPTDATKTTPILAAGGLFLNNSQGESVTAAKDALNQNYSINPFGGVYGGARQTKHRRTTRSRRQTRRRRANKRR